MGVAANLSDEDRVRLLAPFRKSTWRLVDTLGAAAQRPNGLHVK